MKRIKAKTFNEFFASHMGQVAWKRGVNIFQVSAGQNLPNGQYRTQLVRAYFEIPRRGRAQVVFEFKIQEEPNKGQIIRKVLLVDNAFGVGALLNDYRLLKLPSSAITEQGPVMIEAANEYLTSHGPYANVRLEINREGAQTVKIEEVHWPEPQEQGTKPPESTPGEPMAPEPPQAPTEEERAMEAIPESPAPEPEKEVDLHVGMFVRYELDGTMHEGVVRAIFDEEFEVAVQDNATKLKALISAHQIKDILETPSAA